MEFKLKLSGLLNNSKSVLILLLLSAFSLKSCSGAKILIYFLQGSYSQLNIYHPYGVELAERGHEVTFLIGMPYKTPHKKIKYIIPERVSEVLREVHNFLGKQLVQDRETGTDNGFAPLPGGGIQLCSLLLTDPKVLEWIHSPSTTFDLVVVDALFNDCGIGLAYKFKAPHIFFETATVHPWATDTFGLSPSETSWVPDMRRPGLQVNQMSFFQRVRNTLDFLEMYFLSRQLYYLDQLDEILRKALKEPNMPPLKEIEKNVSLVFVNSHYATEFARSLPPLFVQVGGLQCRDIKEPKLPLEMSKFIERFSGFVYVSFGSIFFLNWEKQQIFLETFRKFPHIGFVFRWTGDMPAKELIPENSFLSPWAPQMDLLAHKKILTFVSHGGQLSTQESVFHGVPVLAFPGFADQDYNTECLKRLGVALKLELVGLTVDQLTSGLQEVIYNPTYKVAMKRVSALHRDRPQHPMDAAIWWTEYVIRNSAQGHSFDHLRSPGIHQNWFQRRLLDVWLFIATVILAAFSILVVLVTKIARCLCWKKGKVMKKAKRS